MRKNQTCWESNINKLIDFSAQKGYQVLFNDPKRNNISYIDFKNKIISLASCKNKEKQFYIFLHELGHFRQQSKKTNYKKRFSKVFNEFNNKSLTYGVTEVQEELDAWEEGLDLAKRLKLKVNERNFNMLKAKFVATYMRAALRK